MPPVSPVPAAAPGFYSAAQAERGRLQFRRVCGECHSTRDFRGREFEYNWRRRTVWDFFNRIIETMPEDMPGILSAETYTDVIAYILSLNAYDGNGPDLEPTATAMDAIPLGPGARKTRASSGNEP